jgi:ribosomal protein S18 acetylase RimI-like enzyme
MVEPLGSGPRNTAVWGSNYWISINDFRPVDASEIKPFFTQLAAQEFNNGVNNFYVEVLADKRDQVQEWFELGFGLQHVSAVLRNFLPAAVPLGVKIRPAVEADLDAIAVLEQSLSIHQNQSPVFSTLKPEPLEEIKAEWAESLTDKSLVTFVAEVDDEVVALAYGCSTEKSQLHSGIMRRHNSATLAFCATLPDYRGRGIGKAIASSVIEELFNRGFETIVTDWRMTNQLSSVTWPKLGFVPTLYRLNRSIDFNVIKREAISTYNKAFDLHESGNDDLAAIELANASIHLWRQVGNDQNLAIGYWLASRIYAQFGHSKLAIATSEKSLHHLDQIDKPADWLIASIHEGWARALVSADDPRAKTAIEKTRELIANIADIEDRALIESQFSSISN